MPTDDELIKSMFDEVAEVTVKPDGEVEVKVLEPSAEQEMAAAIENLQGAWKRFKVINREPNAPHHPAHRIEWWRAIDDLGIADGRAREAFLGGQHDPVSIRLYAKWREHWLTGIGGEYYRPNA